MTDLKCVNAKRLILRDMEKSIGEKCGFPSVAAEVAVSQETQEIAGISLIIKLIDI